MAKTKKTPSQSTSPKKRKPAGKKKLKNKILLLNPIFYINTLIGLCILVLLYFIVDTFILGPNTKSTKNKVVKLPTPIKVQNEKEKIEEITKSLKVEYFDKNENKKAIRKDKPSDVIHQEKNTFNFPINEKEIIKETKVKNKINQERFEEITEDTEIEYSSKEIIKKEVIPTSPENIFYFPKNEDKDIKIKVIPLKSKTVKEIQQFTKPKLAILIDDITTSMQIKLVKRINFPITLAFIPPNENHPISARLAKDFPVHMIHLPLEALSHRFEQGDTLKVGDSLEKIDTTIKRLKKLYPNAKYINNHTGSRFTSDHESMDKLMRVLKKYSFEFVDSRTTAKSVVKQYAKKYNMKYLSRNIFLDNNQDKAYIQNQLKKAVKIAKKNGSAIAIGHPHSITLKTLKDSEYLLKDIELVFINQL